MAGDWIKMRSALAADPDVVQIAAALNLDEFGVVGRLHAVWSWLDQHSDDGTNVRIVSAFLDRLTACPGFADSMRAVGWLAGRDGSIDFPGYTEHNGETAKTRALAQKRKAKERDKCHGGSVTREEKRREEHPPKNTPPVPPKPAVADWTGLPPELACDEFREEWGRYVLYRRSQHFRPLGIHSLAEKWRELAAMGAAKAVVAIRHSIANGWQGIFPPIKERKPAGAATAPVHIPGDNAL